MEKEYKITYKQKPKGGLLIVFGLLCVGLTWFILKSWKYFKPLIEEEGNIIGVQLWGVLGYIIAILFLVYCVIELICLTNRLDKYKNNKEETTKELFFTGELKEISAKSIQIKQPSIPKFKIIFKGDKKIK